jgi:hypothetical protein
MAAGCRLGLPGGGFPGAFGAQPGRRHLTLEIAMLFRTTSRTIGLLAALALLAGCARGPTPTPAPPAATATQEPSPTAAALPSATPAARAVTSGVPAAQTAAPSTHTAAPAVPTLPPAPKLDSFDPAGVKDIKLDDYPVIPAISAEAVAIYRAGVSGGNNPHIFSKLGDCMTENEYFLSPFSARKYDLGAYADLQAAIDQFAGVPARLGDWTQDSFATPGLAAAKGFNVAGPLDPTWANPKWCRAGESPAACEYRVAKPSLAIIMFGTNDASYTDAASYDYYLRTLVILTLQNGTLPLLNTFPTRPEAADKSLLLNQIVIKIAADYGVPLVNLNRALESLPNQGVDPKDTIHLSAPPDKRVDVFSAQNLQYGFTVRNLVTLQALQAVLKAVR